METIKATKREIIDSINKNLPTSNKIILENRLGYATTVSKRKYLITENQLACIIKNLVNDDF